MIARSAVVVAAAFLASCDGLNVFTIQDDIELGAQLKAEIDANPRDYPPLDPVAYAEAYGHVERIVDAILASGQVEHADDFPWEVTLIQDDDVLNAFAAPGGYLWVYTGLMKAVETEDALAGVLGHEIGHADGRHSTEQLTELYGVDLLLSIALGQDRGLVADVAQSLVGLGFSRRHERAADELSVRYLCETEYAADGVAMFFDALDGQGVPAFLSTHPDPDNRVEDVRRLADDLGCDTTLSGRDYQAVLDSLP